MGLILRTAPAIEPLTSHEVVTHLRLDATNLEPIPTAPTTALAGLGAGLVDNGTHRYRLTFVTADGQTDGGDITDVVTVADKTVNGQVALSNLPLGGSTVTARKIYRTKAGADVFYLVGTINDNTTLVFNDNIADAALGVGCPAVNTTSDPQIVGLIQTAREVAETWLKRALIQQQWTIVRDQFGEDECYFDELSIPLEIRLPMPNLISVEAVRYRDFSGNWQVLDPTIYFVDITALPGRIIKNYTSVWPVVYPVGASVQIDITCGYGATRASVPQSIKNGMLLLIGELYENRESLNIGNIVNELPALKRLWSAFRYTEAR